MNRNKTFSFHRRSVSQVRSQERATDIESEAERDTNDTKCVTNSTWFVISTQRQKKTHTHTEKLNKLDIVTIWRLNEPKCEIWTVCMRALDVVNWIKSVRYFLVWWECALRISWNIPTYHIYDKRDLLFGYSLDCVCAHCSQIIYFLTVQLLGWLRVSSSKFRARELPCKSIKRQALKCACVCVPCRVSIPLRMAMSCSVDAWTYTVPILIRNTVCPFGNINSNWNRRFFGCRANASNIIKCGMNTSWGESERERENGLALRVAVASIVRLMILLISLCVAQSEWTVFGEHKAREWAQLCTQCLRLDNLLSMLIVYEWRVDVFIECNFSCFFFYYD